MKGDPICDRPKVAGQVTVTISNQAPDLVPPAVFEAGLALISQQLSEQLGDVEVILVPAPQGRGESPAQITLARPGTASSDSLCVPVRPGENWQRELREQVLRFLQR